MRAADIQLLTGPFWLNDQCISFYLEHLSRTYANPRALLLEPSTSFLIALENDPDDLRAGLSRLDLVKPTYLFLPVNDNNDPEAAGGSHWTLLVLSKASWTWYHVNSMGGDSNLAQAMQIARKVDGVLSPPRAKMGLRKIRTRPPQQNGFDCGVFVLAAIETLLQKIGSDADVRDLELFSKNLTEIALKGVERKRGEMLRLARELAGTCEEWERESCRQPSN